MSHRKTLLAAVCALSAPFVLLAIGALRRGHAAWLEEPSLLLSNWLYMAVPSVVVLVVAMLFRAARQRFLPWALMALTLLLVAFQLWVWWFVPVRESALSWVLYHPLAVVTLLVVAVAAAVAARLRRGSSTRV